MESKKQMINADITEFFKEASDEWLNNMLDSPSWKYDKVACHESIIRPIQDLMSRGGKRLRPQLMQIIYNSLGGQEDISKFLIIPELIHNGTLIVDDIEDSSDTRRGKPAIHKIYGDDIAINAGNALYYLPLINIIRDKTLSYEKKAKMYEVVNHEMIKISFGQGMDIYWHKNRVIPTEEEYLQMCAYKTGTLLRMSAHLACILAKASEEQTTHIKKFAETIGVAFQIQDDLLNLTNADWGKDYCEDITEGKKTLIIIKTLEMASKEDEKDLQDILSLKTKNKTLILESLRIIKKYDAMSYCEVFSENLVRDAWSNLDRNLPESSHKKELREMADFAIKRSI